MEKFLVKYALGGGFGGAELAEGEILEFENYKQAEAYAIEMAREEYFSYEGLYGLFDREEALEESPSLTEGDLDAMVEDDLESWIDWSVEKV